MVLVAGFVVGCGSASGLTPGHDAGAGGEGTDAAAGAGGAATGAGGAGGAAAAKPTCGGDLVGLWATSQKNLAPVAPGPSVNACLNLQLTSDGNGFGASTWNPRFGPERDISIVFMTSGAFDIDDLRRGPVVLHYAASCLSSPVGTPTCDELGPAIEVWGHDTGEFQHAACAAASSGGCDCTLDLSVVQGASGTWSSSGAEVTFVDAFSNQVTTSSYCVDGAGLRLDPAFEAVLPGGSGFTLQPVDCTDGKQGPFEDGVDCGWACRNAACP
jgi:hypothetical protein